MYSTIIANCPLTLSLQRAYSLFTLEVRIMQKLHTAVSANRGSGGQKGNFLEVARHPYIAYGRCPPNTIFAAETRHCFVNVLTTVENQSGGIVFFSWPPGGFVLFWRATSRKYPEKLVRQRARGSVKGCVPFLNLSPDISGA